MQRDKFDLPDESTGNANIITRPGLGRGTPSLMGAGRRNLTPLAQANSKRHMPRIGGDNDVNEPSRYNQSSMNVPESPDTGKMPMSRPGSSHIMRDLGSGSYKSPGNATENPVLSDQSLSNKQPAALQSPKPEAEAKSPMMVESKIERERKLSIFLDGEFSHVNYYSPVDPNSSVYEEERVQRYMGRYLFHNKNINLLSYNCTGEKDRRTYEVTFLSFQEPNNRDRMAAFLETLKLASIPNVRRMHNFISDSDTNKSRIVLIDTFQNSINLSNLIGYVKDFPEIATMICQDDFIYKVITILWETIRQFRNKGLKDLGINSNLITLHDRKESQAMIRDPVVKIRRFFRDPTVVIDYKCSHFLRLILSDEKRKNAITIEDLATINFIPKFMVEIIAKYRIEYTDELSFALVILEILKGESCENIARDIDFEQGKMLPNLEASLNHPFFVKIVKKCLKIPKLKDISEYQEDFFSDTNSEFMTLSRLLNSSINNNPIRLQQMHPDILMSGLGLMEKSKLIKILSNSDYENCSNEQLSVVINFLLDNNFMHYAFVYIKSCFTRFDEYNSLYNSFPFVFHLIERIIQDHRIPMAQKITKLHTEDLKQFLSIALNFLFHPKYDAM